MDSDDSEEEMSQTEKNQQKRLDFILNQAEIYAHFIENGKKSQSKSKSKPGKQTARRSQPRRTNRQQSETLNNGDQKNSATARFEQTPSYINGEMRDYQLRGLNWMISLYDNGGNGILADEMGLGKTLQTISMIGFLKHFEGNEGPHLVICPKSTLLNWLNEFNRFCPSIAAVTLKGDEKARAETFDSMKKKKWNVCITTYEICILAKGPLKRIKWQYLVIDEAQRIKNENSLLSRVVRKFSSEHRLLLTGTPLQNNLHELWALLNFLLPNIFSSSDDFDSWFDSNDCLRGNDTIVQRLHTILRPFMLRRIKSEVEKSLLPKKEVKLFIGLTALQREVYKKVLQKDITILNPFGEASQKSIRMILMELRKAANHPYLIDNIEPGPPYTTDEHLINSCGKMMVLDKLLAKLKAQGSKVLLFSEFVIMLNILEDYLEFRGYEYRRLDGDTSYEDRAKGIDEFNAKRSNIFIYLISTRAGGLGINLAAADAVVIYDSSWNPQVDIQAIDRAHRIGQKKQVRVFRLITEDTVDERIVQRAEIKLRLDKMVIQSGRKTDANGNQVTKEDKRSIIRFGLDKIMDPKASDCIGVDIDKLLKEGEAKTAKEQAEYIELGESELRNLTLEDASATSVYQFQGTDFRSMNSARNDTTQNDTTAREFRQREPVNYAESTKMFITLHKFQFFPQELYDMCENIGRLRLHISDNTEQKLSLLNRGFRNWNRDHVQIFCDKMAKYGRNDLERIADAFPSKDLNEVTKYHKTFWERGAKEIDKKMYQNLTEKLFQKERKIDALKWKSSMLDTSESEMTPAITKFLPDNHYERYKPEHDRYLIRMMQQKGLNTPDLYRQILNESRSSQLFADESFKFQNKMQVRLRCDAILEIIVKEFLDDQCKKGAKFARKKYNLYKFQFYPTELYALCSKGRAGFLLDMTDDTECKQSLLSQGFHSWTLDHVKTLCDTMAKFGRNNFIKMKEALPFKTPDEICAYHKTFWERGKNELSKQQYHNLTEKLFEKEEKIDALNWKVALYNSPETQLTLNKFIPENHYEHYTPEHDRYMICALRDIGLTTPDRYQRILADTRFSDLFVDQKFVFHTKAEVRSRCAAILDIIVKEYQNEKRQTDEPSTSNDSQKRKSTGNKGGESNVCLIHKFQFYPQELYDLCQPSGKGHLRLDMTDDVEHKQSLMNRGFKTWNRKHVQMFCDAMAEFGRNNLSKIATALPTKTLDEITNYHETFWKRGETEINKQKYANLTEKLYQKERMVEALNWKVEMYRSSPTELKLNKFIPENHYKHYTPKHDRYLIYEMHEVGLYTEGRYGKILDDLRSNESIDDLSDEFQDVIELRKRCGAVLEVLVKEFLNDKRKGDEGSTNEVVPSKKKKV